MPGEGGLRIWCKIVCSVCVVDLVEVQNIHVPSYTSKEPSEHSIVYNIDITVS